MEKQPQKWGEEVGKPGLAKPMLQDQRSPVLTAPPDPQQDLLQRVWGPYRWGQQWSCPSWEPAAVATCITPELCNPSWLQAALVTICKRGKE